MTPHSLVNGTACTSIDVQDRGLAYGDGVFRTVRIAQGKPVWWPEQLAKLTADGARLRLNMPSSAQWTTDLAQIALPETGVLKLTVTRGVGPRGYAPPEATSSRLMSVWPSVIPLPSEGPVHVCGLRLAVQPALAGIKHLNRLEQVLARAEWSDPALREGLMLDAEDRVISGVSSNLFIYRAGTLYTPRLDRCGVAGLTRDRLIQAAQRHNMPVLDADLRLEAVLAAEEVMLTNSLTGIFRVTQVRDTLWPQPVISPTLCQWLDETVLSH